MKQFSVRAVPIRAPGKVDLVNHIVQLLFFHFYYFCSAYSFNYQRSCVNICNYVD